MAHVRRSPMAAARAYNRVFNPLPLPDTSAPRRAV